MPIQAPPASIYDEPDSAVETVVDDRLPEVDDVETPATVEEALSQVAHVQEELASPEWQPRPSERGDWLAGLRAGDRVYLRGIPQPVEVVTSA